MRLIALKYKEYTNLRGLLAGKDTALGASSLTETPSKKRKSTWDVSSNQIETPKRQKPHSTPSKSLHPAIIDPYDSPSVIRNLQLTPSYRTVIGPTPQRDGKVLGLFDLIDDDEDGSGSLTSKTQPFSGVSPNLHRTPRKPHLEQVVTPLRYGKTPTSTSKRFLLDMFVTPSKRKLMKEDVDEGATPAFLRRDHRRLQSPRYDEKGNLEIDSPVAARLPAKPPLRGLSSLIAGLRKMEEEEFDEEMDVLRELENGSSGAAKGSIVAGVAVNENQGKPSSKDDDLGEQTRENTQQPSLVGKDGKPLKVWKKRGQKRTTKRVNSKSRYPSYRLTRLAPSYHHHVAASTSELIQLRSPSLTRQTNP